VATIRKHELISLFLIFFNEAVKFFGHQAVAAGTSLRLESRMKNQGLSRQLKRQPLCNGGITEISQGPHIDE
jgi:hypothetical protein